MTLDLSDVWEGKESVLLLYSCVPLLWWKYDNYF
jgi:hypothetical protein